jgi:glucose-6-phosphate isomerase
MSSQLDMKMILDPVFQLGLEGLGASDLKGYSDRIVPYLEQFSEKGQGFAHLPKVKAQVLAVKQLAAKLKGKYKNIAILGIGGSALGITCVRDALFGPLYNSHIRKTEEDELERPRLFVLDNLDMVGEFEKVTDLDSTLFIVISKSGRTPETMAQYFYFRERAYREQFVFITDPEGGELRPIGKRDQIPMLDIPKNVGGRFSVLTPVGLLPMALLGVDIEAMLEGAGRMAERFMSPEFDLNLPFQLATLQYLLEYEHGVMITVIFPYSTALLSFADWYKQLLAESIGKDGKGLTPASALGVTDQHSQMQLFNEGPTDKLFITLRVEKDFGPQIPKIKNPELDYLSGITFGRLMEVEQEASEKALSQYKKPLIKLILPEVNESVLGELFMLFEASIAFLGEYYKINAFNQPGVELGKKVTKQILY